jgi:hypothetical protein
LSEVINRFNYTKGNCYEKICSKFNYNKVVHIVWNRLWERNTMYLFSLRCHLIDPFIEDLKQSEEIINDTEK